MHVCPLQKHTQQIDHDCALIPKGALVVDATKRVVFNEYFAGLSFHTSAEFRAYFHFRYPENPQGIAVMNKAGLVKTEFMDCITKDLPVEMWALSQNGAGTLSFIRNLYWEGYTFYAVVNSPEYGGVYFGAGLPNQDIAFML